MEAWLLHLSSVVYNFAPCRLLLHISPLCKHKFQTASLTPHPSPEIISHKILQRDVYTHSLPSSPVTHADLTSAPTS